jgi:uncharacterized protein with gpF-like domain
MSWVPPKLKGISPSYWLKELADVSTRKSIINASTNIAVNMVSRVNVVNVKSWREAALKAQSSRYIYDLLQQELSGPLGIRVRQLVLENARIVGQIPGDVADILSEEIAKAQQQGTRPEALEALLKHRFTDIMSWKIAQVARTQSGSASTALTRARSEELGLPCFIWDTSEDRRVRHSHQIMDGVVVFWNDLPSPESLAGQKSSFGRYAPGDCTNCRCYPRPVLTLEDVFSKKTNLIKVYTDGHIVKMTRMNFSKKSGIESRMAA